MRNLLISLTIVLFTGCWNQRVGDFSVISSRNFDLNSDYVLLEKGVIGEDTQYIIIFIPTGQINIENAVDDALKRAKAYSKAGADAILIHSNEKKPNEIFSFSKKFQKSKYLKPLIAVPSTYSKTYERDLVKNGFKIVIYANHFLRAVHLAIKKVAKSILTNQRSFESEKYIDSIQEILGLIK